MTDTVQEKNIIKFLNFIKAEYPCVYNNKAKLLSKKHKFCQLYGEMMSGKSSTMIALLHYYILNNITGIVFLTNCTDLSQFENSIHDYFSKYRNYYLTESGDTTDTSDTSDTTDTTDTSDIFEYEFINTLKYDKKTKSIIDDNNISDCFNVTGKSKILICVAHEIQLYRMVKLLYKNIKDNGGKKYCCIFDESHITMYSTSKIENSGMSGEEYFNFNMWPHKMTRCELVDLVIHNAEQIVATTATPAQNFFNEKYNFSFIIEIIPGKFYRDVLSINYHIIPEMGKIELHEDPSLHRVLKDLSNIDRYKKSEYNMKRDQPIFLQIQVSRFKEVHYKIKDFIIDNFENKYVVITHNDDGTLVFLPDEICKYLFSKNNSNKIVLEYGYKNPKKEKSIINRCNEIKFSSNMPITSILQFCADLPENLIQRIVLISGDRVKQGRRVNSTDYSIRITHEFLRSESYCDTDMQKLRIVGYVFDDRPPFVVYCTDTTHNNIINNIKNTRSIVNKLKKELNTGILGDNSLSILSELNIYKEKIGNIPMCKTYLPIEVISDDEDDFCEYEDYKIDKEKTAVDVVDVVMPNPKKPKKKKHNYGVKKYKKIISTNSGNELRLINKNSIEKSTILYSIYNYICDIIKSQNINNKWIKRTRITSNLLNLEKKVIKNKAQIEGHLRSLYQTKCSFEGVDEKTKGLLMKKEGNNVFIRLNSI